MAAMEETNLHDVEDYDSEITHDQLPTVEEAKTAMGGTSSMKTFNTKRFNNAGMALVLVIIFFILLKGYKGSEDQKVKDLDLVEVLDISASLNSIALGGPSDFEDPNSYQALAKNSLVTDDMVKDYTFEGLQQRYAMYCLHHATGGLDGSWIEERGWKRKGMPECMWHGVTCAPGTKDVTRIALRENGLQGEIPPEIALIPNLEVFNVNSNDNLVGSIPDSLCAVDGLDIKVDCNVVQCDCCSNASCIES